MALGPDFLCIGSQRAGTGWLYDQLASHPAFRMPLIKELHYFDRLFEWKPLIRLQQQVSQGQRGRALKGKNPYRHADDMDVAFLEGSARLRGRPVDVAAYAALFAPSALLCGDVTPGYGPLPPATISAIAEGLAHLKIIFLWRDPAERAASHLGMAHRQDQLQGVDVSDPASVLDWLARPEVASRSFPTAIWQAWSAAFEQERLQVTAFADVVAEPGPARARIVSFLGGDPQLAGAVAADHNRKADVARLTLSPAVREALDVYFADERRACQDMLAPLGR